ncbi:uncharacterized protein [Physcomitrium patens]|uniref:uncharacterized protein isoform X2 n=1 Tax=Physcomitrium patens TaxID=3218 RepID=UPI003CCE304E
MSVMGSALTLRNSPHFLRHIRPYLLLVSQYRSHVPPPLQAHELRILRAAKLELGITFTQSFPKLTRSKEAVGNKCRYCHRNSVCKRKKCSQLRPAAQISEPRFQPHSLTGFVGSQSSWAQKSFNILKGFLI